MAVHRAYNKSFVEDGVFYKCSQEDRLADESHYYDELPHTLRRRFPKKISGVSTPTHYILALEDLPWKNVGELYLNQAMLPAHWSYICSHIAETLNHFEETAVELPKSVKRAFDEPPSVNAFKMYLDKTRNEYLRLKETDEYWGALLEAPTITVNGETLRNFGQLEEAFNKYWLYNWEYTPTIIHGDLCFSNILVAPDFSEIKLIDPRGSFGRRGIWGDSDYDYAKLLHSYHGMYEALIYNRFQVQNVEFGRFEIEADSEDCQEYRRIADAVFGPPTKRIKMIEGLIFIGMCARHYDDFSRQLAMYLTGLKILNELL